MSSTGVWAVWQDLAEFFSFAAIKNGHSLCLGQRVTSSSKCHATGGNCVSTKDWGNVSGCLEKWLLSLFSILGSCRAFGACLWIPVLIPPQHTKGMLLFNASNKFVLVFWFLFFFFWFSFPLALSRLSPQKNCLQMFRRKEGLKI